MKNPVTISNSHAFNSDQRLLNSSSHCIKSNKGIECEQFALGRVLTFWNSNDENFFSSYSVRSQTNSLRYCNWLLIIDYQRQRWKYILFERENINHKHTRIEIRTCRVCK